MLYKQFPCSASSGFRCHFWTINIFFINFSESAAPVTILHPLNDSLFLLSCCMIYPVLPSSINTLWNGENISVLFFFSFLNMKVFCLPGTGRKVAVRTSWLMSLLYWNMKFLRLWGALSLMEAMSSACLVRAQSPAWCRGEFGACMRFVLSSSI